MTLEELEKQLYECSQEIRRLYALMYDYPQSLEGEKWLSEFKSAKALMTNLKSQHSILLASGARHVALDTTPLSTPEDDELFAPEYTPSSYSEIEFMGGPMDGTYIGEDGYECFVLADGLVIFTICGVNHGYMKNGNKLMFFEVVS